MRKGREGCFASFWPSTTLAAPLASLLLDRNVLKDAGTCRCIIDCCCCLKQLQYHGACSSLHSFRLCRGSPPLLDAAPLPFNPGC